MTDRDERYADFTSLRAACTVYLTRDLTSRGTWDGKKNIGGMSNKLANVQNYF
jgi:hypothetical protein